MRSCTSRRGAAALLSVAFVLALLGVATAQDATTPARRAIEPLGLALECPSDWELTWDAEKNAARLRSPAGAVITLRRWSTRRDFDAARAAIEATAGRAGWQAVEPLAPAQTGTDTHRARGIYEIALQDATRTVRLGVWLADSDRGTWLLTYGDRADRFDRAFGERIAASVRPIEPARAADTAAAESAPGATAPEATAETATAPPEAERSREGGAPEAAEASPPREPGPAATAQAPATPTAQPAHAPGAGSPEASSGAVTAEPATESTEATAAAPSAVSPEAAAADTVTQTAATESEASRRVHADLQALAIAIDLFASDTGTLPDTLGELLASDRLGWQGPYLGDGDARMLRDPWGRPYVYARVGSGKPPYLLGSFGADARPGGEGEAADIFNRTDVPPPGSSPRPMPEALAERIHTDLLVLRVAIGRFRRDTGRWPETLEQLVNGAGIERWRGPYVLGGESGLLDPWQHPYVYERPGPEGAPYRVGTLGADAAPGGEGKDSDVFENGEPTP